MTQVSVSDKSNVQFRFFNISVDNIPFCNKYFSLKLHFRYNSFSTDFAPTKEFSVIWHNLLEFQYLVTRDISGHAALVSLDFTLYSSNDFKGSGKEEIATAKYDASSILKHGLKKVTIPLTSSILESKLTMDVEANGGEIFFEIPPTQEKQQTENFPKVITRIKNGWHSYQHNMEQIDIDTNALIAAATSKH